MANYVAQVRKLTQRYEKQARKRIEELRRSPAATRGRAELLRAVKKLRTTLNKQLMALEKRLAAPKK